MRERAPRRIAGAALSFVLERIYVGHRIDTDDTRGATDVMRERLFTMRMSEEEYQRLQ
jgi:hypothetical protein